MLREQKMRIPELINLPDIVAFFDDWNDYQGELRAEKIPVDDFVNAIKDLRCWIKHFYEKSAIPKLTKIKAV